MLPFGDIAPASELFRTVRIKRIQTLADQTKRFELEPVGWTLDYKPGQFLTFVIPSPAGLVRRSYSLCSLPGESPAIAVKRVANGVFSRPMLESAEPGDTLTVAGGATGFFTLPDNLKDYDECLFLAAGSGITPVLPMIRFALRKQDRLRLLLAYSNSRVESAMFRNELEELERQNPQRLSITWYFSNRQDLKMARLSKSSLEDFLRKEMKARPDRTLAFLCGPFDYMRMAAIVLQAKGIPAENIRREVFTPHPLGIRTAPPDTSRRDVTLRIQGKVHRVSTQYPATILAAARAAGIELPYSCESGRCGSCIAACTEGQVWMRYNEVLTDKEVAAGRVLVCQAFPVGGDVTIEYV